MEVRMRWVNRIADELEAIPAKVKSEVTSLTLKATVYIE
jgi:hypothetical protein